MKFFLLQLIFIYQKTISPDHGLFKLRFPHGFCPLYPSCSEYARQALVSHGTLKALWLIVRRLLRCHPFQKPHVDLVP
jgi:putative membrane protein insertion efficiency factor